jgi:hypothetical protein
MTWYRFIIPKGSEPHDTLQALVEHITGRFVNEWGRIPEDAALLARPTDYDGVEVRITERVARIIRSDFTSTYVEACDVPRGWHVWRLQLGGEHWRDELGIELAEE